MDTIKYNDQNKIYCPICFALILDYSQYHDQDDQHNQDDGHPIVHKCAHLEYIYTDSVNEFLYLSDSFLKHKNLAEKDDLDMVEYLLDNVPSDGILVTNYADGISMCGPWCNTDYFLFTH